MFILKLYHLYLIALFPVVLSLVMATFSKGKITLKEWMSGAIGAFVCALLMHLFSWMGRTNDFEIWSGSVISVIHEPSWRARWEETDYIRIPTGRDSNGFTTYTRVPCGSHYEYSTHNEKYYVQTDLDQIIYIDKTFADDISSKFGDWNPQKWTRNNFYEGDPNRYVAGNKTGWLQPVTKRYDFENRAKAAPSRFSFKKVPENIRVFKYPENNNAFKSDRIMGTARQTFDSLAFDQLCSRIGPTKNVNLIIIGFGEEEQEIVSWQRSAWYGGKKNDLVLCYGGQDPLNPEWVSVFGWSQELVEKPLLDLMASSTMDSTILPKIEKIIMEKYVAADWDSMMKRVDVEMPAWSWIVMIGFILVSQGGYYFWAWKNELTDEN